MSFVMILAQRFLTGKKRNTFISFIAAISLFGVSLGVAALVVVMAVMEGFESELRSIITATHSHVVLYSKRNLIPNKFELEERVKKIAPEVVAISPYIFSEVMLAHKGRVVGSMVEGVDELTVQKTTDISKHLARGIFPTPGFHNNEGKELKLPTIVIGSAIAEKLAAKEGDEISVISPFFDQESMQPRSRRFIMAGILSTGMYEYDSKYSVISADEAADFFRLPSGSVSALKIKTSDPDKSFQVAQKLKSELGYPYNARDWTELNRNLLYAIKLQKVVIFIVLTSIIVVAAFNIMSTLVMMMNEKKREMAILKAMGMNNRQSASVFVLVGSILGISGALAGVSFGLLLCGILAKTRFIHLPPDIYFISYLPVDIQTSTLVIIGICATVVALMATIYPSMRVVKESPVEGLRYE